VGNIRHTASDNWKKVQTTDDSDLYTRVCTAFRDQP
jgi:hypothetical protein